MRSWVRSWIFSQGMFYKEEDAASVEDKPERVPLLVAVPAGAEAYRLVESR